MGGGRQKVGTQKNYFQNQEKGGGKMCLKTFVMIRCSNIQKSGSKSQNQENDPPLQLGTGR